MLRLSLAAMTNDLPELLALAATCEAASGPSLALNLSVHGALERWLGADAAENVSSLILKKRLREGRPYTGSVAAALAPVPTGSWWEVTSDGEGYSAWVGHGDHIGRATARTVPLAILGAALRALQAFLDVSDSQSGNPSAPSAESS